MPDRLQWRRCWVGKVRRPEGVQYFIRWNEGARTRQLNFPTLSAARRAASIREQELNTWMRATELATWAHMVTEYGLHVAGFSAAHVNDIDLALQRFWTVAKPRTAHDVTPAACEEFFAVRRAGGPELAPAPDARKGNATPRKPRIPTQDTLAKERRLLRAFCGYCVERGWLPDNPVRHVAVIRPLHKKKRTPRQADWLKLLKACPTADANLDDPQAWHLLVLLGVVTGWRQSVLLPLEIGHVELAAEPDGIGLLRGFSGKTRKEELHGLPSVVNDRLAQRIAALPDGTRYVFPWRTWGRKAWERLNRAAGVRFTFHSLRAASGTATAVAKAHQAGARHLSHSAATVFRQHYSDDELIARAVASELELPALPPLPPYVPPAARPARRGHPPGGTSAAPRESATAAPDPAG